VLPLTLRLAPEVLLGDLIWFWFVIIRQEMLQKFRFRPEADLAYYVEANLTNNFT